MKESIKNRFGFTIAALIAVIILSISLPLIIFNTRSMEKNLEGQISKLIEFSEETLPAALWQYNYDYANDFMASLFLYDDVIFTVLKVNGKEIVKKVRHDYQPHSFTWFKASKDFLTKEAQIFYKNIPVGIIYLVISRDRINKQVRNNLLLSFLIIILLTTGVLFTNIKMSNLYIFNPLLSLENSVNNISHGNLNTKIEINRDDEIGHLAKSFESMMANLKRLTASRDELNYEISQRKKTERKYRNLYENAQIGMFQSRIIDGKIVESNLRMAQIFGYASPAECIEKYVAEEHYVNPSQRQEVVQLLEEYGTVLNYQTQVKKDDGNVIWIQFSGSVSDDDNFFEGVAADITEQKLAEQKVQASLDEKEVLLKEIHHRVKNNLQMIQSLLSLQQNEIEDSEQKKALIDSSSRIKCMALIHETLYHSEDIGKLNVNSYFNEIVKSLLKIYSNHETKLDIFIQVDDIDMNLDHCISCGLIINELISNAMKYAFKDRKNGKIILTLKQKETNLVEMLISDDGGGFKVLKDINEYSSLGLRMVNIIVKGQLNGSIDISSKKGVSFLINFPKKAHG